MVKVPTQTPVTILFLLLLSLETSFVPSVPQSIGCLLLHRLYVLLSQVSYDDLDGFLGYPTRLCQLLGSSFTWRCFPSSFTWNQGFCDSLYRDCIYLKHLTKRVTLVFGTNGIVTVLGLCLVSGFQCFSADSERN